MSKVPPKVEIITIHDQSDNGGLSIGQMINTSAPDRYPGHWKVIGRKNNVDGSRTYMIEQAEIMAEPSLLERLKKLKRPKHGKGMR